MGNKEHVYDEEIFPLMKQILEICKREEIPMFASFEYDGNSFCRSMINPEGAHMVTGLLDILAKCAEGKGTNIDKFFITIGKLYPNESSAVLKLMGIEPKTN
jgi:hypothetical protein